MKKIYMTLAMFSVLVLPAFSQTSLVPEPGYEISTWLLEFSNGGAFDFSDTLFYFNDGDSIHMMDLNSGDGTLRTNCLCDPSQTG